MPRRHQRPRLLHMLPQHLAQPRVQQVRSRMIPHSSGANLGVDDGVDSITDLEGAPPYAVFVGWGFWCGLHNNLMRPHALNRVITSLHFSDHGIVIVRIEPTAVANLPASLRIERSVVENDLAGLAGLELLRPLPVVNDGQNLAAFRPRLLVSLK